MSSVMVSLNFRSFVYQPDVYHLHEIEIDPDGKNLFLLSRYWLNRDNRENWILIYDEERGNDSEVVHKWLSDPSDGQPDVDGPTAMLVSSSGDTLYLASSVDSLSEPNDLITEVYGFTMSTNGKRVVNLTLTSEDIIYINCPLPRICYTHPRLCDENMGFVSMITSMAENPVDGTLYVTGLTAPKFAAWDELPYLDKIFTTPMLAVVPPDTTSANAYEMTGSDVALPLSLVWVPPEPGSTGTALHAKVGMRDLCMLAAYWLDSGHASSN